MSKECESVRSLLGNTTTAALGARAGKGRAVVLVSLSWLCWGGPFWPISLGRVPDLLWGVAAARRGSPACLCLPPSSAFASPHAQQCRGYSSPSATGDLGVPRECSAQPLGEPDHALKGTLQRQTSQQVNAEKKTTRCKL